MAQVIDLRNYRPENKTVLVPQKKKEENDSDKNKILGGVISQLEIVGAIERERELANLQHESEDLYEEGMEYKKPSKVKYGILYAMAIFVDGINLVSLTGIGAIFSVLASFIVSFLMFLIFWFTNTKQKRADEYSHKVSVFLENMPKNIAHLERRAVRVGKFAGKLKPVQKPATKTFVALEKSPLSKFVASAVANLIPFLDILPWMILGVWLSYRNEKASYVNARKAVTEGVKPAFIEVAQTLVA